MPRVLVVDDNSSVREVVERALETKGFELLFASSGEEAMERIGTAMPDLVVCDVVMPDAEGYQICEFLRRHGALSETPVLLLSGIVNGAVLERAAQVRSSDVLRKPFTADELARKVDDLLAAHSPIAAVPGGRPAAPPDLKAILGLLAAMPAVRLAALVDREGFVLEAAGESGVGAEVAGALAAGLIQSAEGIGGGLGQGALSSMVLDYEGGMILLHAAGASATLVVGLRDPTALSQVRYSIEKALPEMRRSI